MKNAQIIRTVSESAHDASPHGQRAGRPTARLAVCLIAAALVWAALASLTAPPASATTTAPRKLVPEATRLEGVACRSATVCVAVGGGSSGQGVVVTITNGVPGASYPVPGTTGLHSVTCMTPTECGSVGTGSGGEGVYVPIKDGVPYPAVVAPGTASLASISCPSIYSCYAVGHDNTYGVVVPLTLGRPGTAQRVAGTRGLYGVACPSTSRCQAVGAQSDVTGVWGVVASIINGTPVATPVGQNVNNLIAVACPTETTCQAVGYGYSEAEHRIQGVVVPIADDAPGAAKWVAGTDFLQGIACTDTANCQAVGVNYVGATGGHVVPVKNGVPGAGKVVPNVYELRGVACPSGGTLCQAVGSHTNTYSSGVVVTLMVTPAKTTTKLSFAPATPKVGSPVTFTASVAPASANTSVPTGSVRFYLDGQTTPVATAALAGGKATFITSTLKVGSHTMKATFAGSADFATSTSALVNVTVTG